VEEFRTYIVNNGHPIPNDGERYRHSEAIVTGCVESTVNHVVSNGSGSSSRCSGRNVGRICCHRRASKTLNRELGTMFKRWYPDMEIEELPEAA
jgi:hypothetical protein